MKLNHIFSASVLSIALLFAACSGSSDKGKAEAPKAETQESSKLSGTMNVDAAKSTLNWKGVMLGVKEHTGTLKLKSGSITLKDGNITGGKFVVDMKSLATTDNNYSAEQTSDMLIGHLSSPDFFAIESNPTASFDIIGTDGAKIAGTLNVRGKNGAEKIENVTISEEGDMVKISGTLKFNRKNYDVKFDMPMKEMVISDDVNVDITLMAKK